MFQGPSTLMAPLSIVVDILTQGLLSADFLQLEPKIGRSSFREQVIHCAMVYLTHLERMACYIQRDMLLHLAHCIKQVLEVKISTSIK